MKLKSNIIIVSFSLIAFLMLLCVSCSGDENAGNEVSEGPVPTEIGPIDTVGAEGTASVSLDYEGTYKGVVPCADCEGIETTLTIKADQTYTLSARYLGKGDEKPANASGKWSWKTGNIILLEGTTFGPDQFFISEGKVYQLDLQGNRITGNLAESYILSKQ